MSTLIIKGALYITEGKTIVLRPHFTGEYHTVDCTEYLQKDEIKEKYDYDFYRDAIKHNKKIEVNGVFYYECESSAWETNGMELLSDLSSLEYFDDQTNF